MGVAYVKTEDKSYSQPYTFIYEPLELIFDPNEDEDEDDYDLTEDEKHEKGEKKGKGKKLFLIIGGLGLAIAFFFVMRLLYRKWKER